MFEPSLQIDPVLVPTNHTLNTFPFPPEGSDDSVVLRLVWTYCKINNNNHWIIVMDELLIMTIIVHFRWVSN